MKTVKEAAQEFAEKRLTAKGREETGDYPPIAWFTAGVEFAQRWISVDEELPPLEKKVLVKLSTGNWSTSKRYISTVSGMEHWSGSGSFAESITHWRPVELK
jgi:hypothetical protein